MHRTILLVLFLAGCTSPAIESYCNATVDGVDCSFTNMGGTGSRCVEITLKRKDGELSTTTAKPLCSGDLKKMETANVTGTFSDPQPAEVCKDTEGNVSWEECDLLVRTVGN